MEIPKYHEVQPFEVQAHTIHDKYNNLKHQL